MALVAGLVLIGLSLALFLIPQRGQLNVQLLLGGGCESEGAAPLSAQQSCEHAARLRVAESAVSLVGGSLLVLSGALGASELTRRGTARRGSSRPPTPT